MGMAIINSLFKSKTLNRESVKTREISNLTQCETNVSYTIKGINTQDKEMEKFLFTLGCYEGEKITVISLLVDNYIINIKDARYSIDKELAQGILI